MYHIFNCVLFSQNEYSIEIIKDINNLRQNNKN